MPLETVFFDLDGTLVDARDAAWEIFAETNDLYELGIDTQDKFLALSETNIFSALSQYCADEVQAKSVIDHFMDNIVNRYHPPFIPGMIEIVRQFNKQISLAILSSNISETIRRILAEGGITECFPIIMSGDVEPSKTKAIQSFLDDDNSRISTTVFQTTSGYRSLTGDEVALVTDTVGDVTAALCGGIRACGVSWGMHSKSKLLDAGAEYVADTPNELMHWFNEARVSNETRS